MNITNTDRHRFSGKWETKRVSEFGDVVTGETPNIRNKAFWDGPYPWITPTDITSDRDMTVSERMLTQEGLNSIRRMLPSNTVLITCIASIGKNAILRKTGTCNQQINAVVPNAAHNAEFLYYLFEHNSDYLLANAGVTATPIISKFLFSEFVFKVPSLNEQRAIAEALSDVDGLLNSLEALISKKQMIKQAVMQQLLTGRTRLSGFSGKWETKRLGEIASFFKGSGLSKADLSLDGKRRCIHYGELFTTYGECITEVLHGTDRDGTFFLSLCNDVLMPGSDVTPNGLATASCISIPDVILGGDILVIRAPSDILNGTFLAYAVKINRNQVMQLISGTTVYHLYGRDMAHFSFAVPNVEEQHAITSVLSDMDAEITALEQRRDKTIAIKQGMMQQLLTGHVRLVKSE